MNFKLNDLYEVVGISKQAVHKFRKSNEIFDVKLEELFTQVDILREDHPGCGARKMYYTLKPDFIGRDRFEALMMRYGYRIKYPKNYIRTTISAHYRYPNLIEGCCIAEMNLIWQSDITYIHVNGRFYYIVFILDVYSRRILGYEASDHLRAQANVKALNQALSIRKEERLSKLFHHSDRGSQYISHEYTGILTSRSIAISMGLKATENAYAERINGIIKNEYLKYREMKNLADLKRELKRAVNHYNKYRQHNNLQRMSPVDFEKKLINLNDQKKPTVTIHTDGYDKFKEASNLFELRPERNLGIQICPIL